MSPDKTSSIYRSKGVCVKPKAWKLTLKDLRQSQSRFATASGNLPVPPKPDLACYTTFLRKALSKSRHFDVGSLQLHLSSELVCPTDDILKLKARLIRQLRVGNLQIYMRNISTRQNQSSSGAREAKCFVGLVIFFAGVLFCVRAHQLVSETALAFNFRAYKQPAQVFKVVRFKWIGRPYWTRPPLSSM